MEIEPDKKKEHREISYQVGWKKGKIAWKENETGSVQAQPESGVDVYFPSVDNKRLKLLWRPAMRLPSGALLPLLYALPIICFAVTLILITGLR
ncbi:hypothetical protein [Paenibacillus whitsoniae]|uniref:Uncharacterized protein n=1 Tax=Paenibacillus whitsoniae TaxID=2496558 RepID=A0A3S0BQB8_9BACL|nr:hypothetical protein [Paenibacillus whitsoniae]RTE01994.1 hypothetical protein EJQ19_30370 [Paenibacillus whitsoniae]